jgi:hypothetical protein
MAELKKPFRGAQRGSGVLSFFGLTGFHGSRDESSQIDQNDGMNKKTR